MTVLHSRMTSDPKIGYTVGHSPGYPRFRLGWPVGSHMLSVKGEMFVSKKFDNQRRANVPFAMLEAG